MQHSTGDAQNRGIKNSNIQWLNQRHQKIVNVPWLTNMPLKSPPCRPGVSFPPRPDTTRIQDALAMDHLKFFSSNLMRILNSQQILEHRHSFDEARLAAMSSTMLRNIAMTLKCRHPRNPSTVANVPERKTSARLRSTKDSSGHVPGCWFARRHPDSRNRGSRRSQQM